MLAAFMTVNFEKANVLHHNGARMDDVDEDNRNCLHYLFGALDLSFDLLSFALENM